MARQATPTHDAWKIGTHEIPDDVTVQHNFDFVDGDVLVHDLMRDAWYVMSERDFDTLYEWIT